MRHRDPTGWRYLLRMLERESRRQIHRLLRRYTARVFNKKPRFMR